MPHQQYQKCIDACNDCAVECEHCASSCLQEDKVQEMARCIRLDLDCSLVCAMTSKLMARGSEFAPEFCRQCAEVCDACAEECARHDDEHCQRCAKTCRRCAEECRKMASITV